MYKKICISCIKEDCNYSKEDCPLYLKTIFLRTDNAEVIKQFISTQISKARQEGREEALKELKKRIKSLTRKPTHGTCCTCQDCGQSHDDCNCTEIEIINNLISILSPNNQE